MATGANTSNVRSLYQDAQPSEYHPPPPVSLPADVEIHRTNGRLRDWARHLEQNSSIASAILDARQTHGIGEGLRYEPLVRLPSGDLHTELNDRIRQVIVERWSRAADVTGELSRQDIERLCWRSWDQDGEIFARLVYFAPRRDAPSPRIQLIESELVPDGIDIGTSRDGIERDQWGRPTQYWILPYPIGITYPTEPGGIPDATPVDARYVRHLRRQSRPNQTRGITLLHAVISAIFDTSEYMYSHRLAARASTDMFMSVNRSPDMIAIDDVERRWQFEKLQIIDDLLPGETVNFHDPQHPNQDAPNFRREELRAIASGTRCAFSWIAQVFDSSYAAQRLEIVHAWRLIEEDRAQFVRRIARPFLYEAPLRSAIVEQLIDPQLLNAADPETLLEARISGPSMPIIDPVKDRSARKMDQENGWDSRQGIIRGLGRSPDQVDAEREQDDFLRTQQDASFDAQNEERSEDDRA